jgi:hypothetical protein
MFKMSSSGSFKNTDAFLKKLSNQKSLYSELPRYGQMGVAALSSATPIDSSETSKSWGYRILKGRNESVGIAWFNKHEEDGVNIAVLIQYGHGTGTGGYVAGRDYINPAIRPIFDMIADSIWKKVTSG